MITFSVEEIQVQDKFLWLDYNHQYLKELRERYKLRSLVNDDMDDLVKVKAVMNWVNNLWEHNGEKVPDHFDPLYILEQVFKGNQYRCVEYAVVLNGCLNALGLRSRLLSLKTQDCETRQYGAGHVVVEIYISKIRKWIMADPQFNVVTYKNNQPLNAVELALSNKSTVDIKGSFNDGFSYYDWIFPYLFFFTINFDNRVNIDRSYKDKKQLMLVPLGSHFPKVFQQAYSIGDVEYTNAVSRIYYNPI
ncbi:transglutaminase domain-containing protein [Gottfriedia acidiceleris]|uniref:transglutaminase domain-containing protein n=1 Tax=Gottfriedia acidiceleris TaxID=371036 RepID=UPI000B452EB7|nr:transglutaminase domain-containing protein [Gottfriedia acidiceleris]